MRLTQVQMMVGPDQLRLNINEEETIIQWGDVWVKHETWMLESKDHIEIGDLTITGFSFSFNPSVYIFENRCDGIKKDSKLFLHTNSGVMTLDLTEVATEALVNWGGEVQRIPQDPLSVYLEFQHWADPPNADAEPDQVS